MDNNLKKIIYDKQFKHKIPFYFFIFNKKFFLLFIVIIYLFFKDKRDNFETFILIAASIYTLWSYIKGDKYYCNFISSDIDRENFFIKIYNKVKKYVYKKNF